VPEEAQSGRVDLSSKLYSKQRIEIDRFTSLICLVKLDAHPAEPTSPCCVDNWDLPDNQKADVEEDHNDEYVEDDYGFDPSLHVYQPDTVLATCADTDEGT